MSTYDIAALRAALSDPTHVCRALRLDVSAQRQSSGGLFVCCPAHAERTASCSVTRGRDKLLRVKCFGCPLAGDVFDLIAAVLGVDRRQGFREVLTRAAEMAGEAPRVMHRDVKPEDPSLGDIDDETFSKLVAPLLHVGRLDDPDLYEHTSIAGDVSLYLERRGLLVQARREGWAALPPPRAQASWIRMLVDNFGEQTVRRSGLVPERGPMRALLYAEHRLVIPWRDAQGRVYTLERRRLDDQKPKYTMATRRPPRAPYGVHGLRRGTGLHLVAFVEGALDALAIEQLYAERGLCVLALGIPGVSNWHRSWARLAAGRKAIVALDADSAGEAAVRRVAEDLAEEGAWPVERHSPRRGKDWGEMWMEKCA